MPEVASGEVAVAPNHFVVLAEGGQGKEWPGGKDVPVDALLFPGEVECSDVDAPVCEVVTWLFVVWSKTGVRVTGQCLREEPGRCLWLWALIRGAGGAGAGGASTAWEAVRSEDML